MLFTLINTYWSVICRRLNSLRYIQTIYAWNVAFFQHLKAWKMSQSLGPKLSDYKTFAWISVTVDGLMFEKLTTETSTWDICKQCDVLQHKNYMCLSQVCRFNITAISSLNNSIFKPPNLISTQIATFVMLYDSSCSYPCLFLMCHTPSWCMENQCHACALPFAWSWYRYRCKLKVDWCFLQCMHTHILTIHHNMPATRRKQSVHHWTLYRKEWNFSLKTKVLGTLLCLNCNYEVTETGSQPSLDT